jgi:hypothetical protein
MWNTHAGNIVRPQPRSGTSTAQSTPSQAEWIKDDSESITIKRARGVLEFVKRLGSLLLLLSMKWYCVIETDWCPSIPVMDVSEAQERTP